MLVSKLQPTFRPITNRVSSKTQTVAKRLSQINFPQAKAIIANPQKTTAIKANTEGGTGGICSDNFTYSNFIPD